MLGFKCIFVEKKHGFNVEAKSLMEDFKSNLRIDNLQEVRVINKYILGEMKEEYYKKSLYTIFAEKTVDNLYEENLPINEDEVAFAVEFLPGQYDQRADSASECIGLLGAEDRVEVKSAKVIVLKGNLTEDEVNKIKSYYINPVDSREVAIDNIELSSKLAEPNDVEILNDFVNKDRKQIEEFHKELGLAMSIDDLVMIRDYFKSEEKVPTITEIKVIDTYWSDHCRHTTFSTAIEDVTFEIGELNNAAQKSYEAYLKSRDFVYGETDRDETLMDIAVITMKEMRKRGMLDDLDISEEINACSIKVNIETDKGNEEYLVMFKNETHNHPTEIEPFGGAATCLGGAIRDPLSGRTYVYQAMRVTGAADPTVPVEDTIKGKLPQRTITLGAAHGYSSYGNQIGLATGQVSEVYHPNYVAKRMEVGAVIAAAPKENVVREEPNAGDIVILLGGRTGRDGVGGATGSSKEHTEDSINECAAEVQKGNAPTERKIQRLFRNAEIAKMIKRCNDFGAGGVSVAIGELTRGLDINLDNVPKKYEGLDGTEIAISESQERMAVVVNKENVDRFIELSKVENLEAVVVAEVTDTERLRMYWRGKEIVNLKRSFLDTNGARQVTNVEVKLPGEYPLAVGDIDVKEAWVNNLKKLNVASQKGLVERFDSTIGGGTVLMPYGGKDANTEQEAMVAKIPVLNGVSEEATIMSYGFNPDLGVWSPYHMAYYSIIEAVTKLAAVGGDYRKARLTLQEYFEKLGKNAERWGKPFAALLGAYQAQIDLGIPAIGGKDSMSGSFGDIDVPPTLVAFAVGVEKAKNIISAELKEAGSQLVFLMAERNEDYTLKVEGYKNNLEKLHELILEGKVISAASVKFGGVAETLSKMAFGNKIGVKFSNLTKEELFGLNYGSLVLEVKSDVNIDEEFKGCAYKAIGSTIKDEVIISEEYDLDLKLSALEESYEEKLSKVFKIKTKSSNEKVEEVLFDKVNVNSPIIKVAKPKVIIPVFPGTNCEYDCERAFRNAGAETETLVFRNYSKDAFVESIENLEKQIRESQIIMLPGGFSAGDEPDGSGKFISTVFRNERIKDAVMDLLKNRDGLMLGICNGFQALIKLGLVPYGEIVDIEEDMATLTYNEINRHMSSIIQTKVVSKKSPWFNGIELGDIHNVAISHGEGRFVAPEKLLKQLVENGQVATQYVDNKGNIALDMPFNPNGSMLGIEGITSPDGRVLGKMGHSERIGDNLYKNVPGNFDQKIFESGVKYFK
ncbi:MULTISPECIES: phosphoribosylformylglycinamidine synthase [unclassified Clostridium]|uniref:phosphoribosylformylglycinamidine synthase n=1 Tax=Clostridium TaxID=1485 RepID=UPI001C8CACF6|nr:MULTISPECIES: phosphoribosylformylglycinamidine synthase [unclassified Clostridium]MBX9137992.1 phosphoribosylformylglycinamidine synthase [Clostridium sp. K12(2020)]MBX9144745.1 phosphoribosylformylglycinamidine synthase [Clostridium sp. K13]MDU2291741.1 phosphoribosylformylglycinamidine synthase [Clostridium celatum]MDU4325267.1 phosphoribosylformylglycinamidine synthase [Clostridium celatum]